MKRIGFLLLLCLVLIGLLYLRYEPFTSTGTLIQLQTSRVPTMEDVYAAEAERRHVMRIIYGI
jgi:hypothetical protein